MIAASEFKKIAPTPDL